MKENCVFGIITLLFYENPRCIKEKSKCCQAFFLSFFFTPLSKKNEYLKVSLLSIFFPGASRQKNDRVVFQTEGFFFVLELEPFYWKNLFD